MGLICQYVLKELFASIGKLNAILELSLLGRLSL